MRMFKFTIVMIAMVSVLLASDAPSRGGALEVLSDAASTALTVHVGAAPVKPIPNGLNGGLGASAQILSATATPVLAVNSKVLGISVNPGQTVTLTCAEQAAVSSGSQTWTLATLDVLLTNDFRPGSFMAQNLAFRVYPAGQPARGKFLPFIAWADNTGSASNQVSVARSVPNHTWNASYCIDLRLSVPAYVSPGDYYSTMSWELFKSTTFHGRPTPSSSPTASPTPTPPPYVFTAGSYVEQAASGNLSAIEAFDANANGNVAPLFKIFSSVAGEPLSNPDAIRFGPDGNLYVSNYGDWAFYPTGTLNSAILAFPFGSSGTTAPVRYIAGSNTGFYRIMSLSLDGAGDIFVENTGPSSTIQILRFAPGANGNVTPASTLSAGSGSAVYSASGIAALPNGSLYVSNNISAYGSYTGNVIEFAPGANGNATPIATISGSNTQIGFPYGVDVDAKGNIYVLTSDNGNGQINYSTGLGVLSNPRICVYAAGSNGNVTPIAVIGGSQTQIVEPVALRVAPDGGVYVAQDRVYAPAALLYFKSGSNGNVAPTAVVSGSNTGFDTYGLRAVGF